ncbi:MAG: dTDP-4-dehydrorhamnose reductase, partial [Candidatus Methanofastidiosia archaeon]
MKILLTGGSGALGRAISHRYQKEHKIFKTFNENPIKDGIRLDIQNSGKIESLVRSLESEIVIHSAALTNVDLCEIERKKAFEVNVLGTENLVNACMREEIKLIFLSTDFIFNGEKGRYEESDKPNPINYYGKTKLLAEDRVRELENYLILRTSVLYGNYGWNFVKWVINELSHKKEIKIVQDQYNSPTLQQNLAEIIFSLIDEKGIFHTAGSERISRFEFARKIAKIFELDDSLIDPIKSKDLKQAAKRPRDSSLCVCKLKKLGVKVLGVEEGLRKMRERFSF